MAVRKTNKTKTAETVAPVVAEVVVEKVAESTVKTTPVVKKIESDTMIECRNGTHGLLNYDSTRNVGMSWQWTEFGEVQEIPYGELVVMRGSQRRFFEENWILIEDADVLKQLGVEKYYVNALTTDNFDDVFTWSAEDIKAKIPKMSNGMQSSINHRAIELVKSGELDKLSVINALNEVFDCDLVENAKD